MTTEQQITFFTDLFGSIIIFLIGYYVFLKDPRRTINRLFFLNTLAGTLWGVGEIGLRILAKETFLVFFSIPYSIGLSFAASLLLHLCLVFTEKKEILKKRIFLILLYFPSFLFPLPIPARYFNVLFPLYFEAYLLISALLLVKRHLSLRSIQEKAKIKSFLTGLLIPAIGGSIVAFFLPIFFGIRSYVSLSFPFSVLGYLFIARGIIRWRTFIDYRGILETVFRRLSELVILTDREGIVILTNDITPQRLDFSQEELRGKNIKELLRGGEIDFSKIKERLKKEGLFQGRISFLTKEKRKIPYLLVASKSKEGIIFVGRDIKELVEYQEKLEEEVKARTKELEGAKRILEVKVKERTKELEALAQSLEEKVKGRTRELQKRVDELERFHKLTVGRELKMKELKEEVEGLKRAIEERKKE